MLDEILVVEEMVRPFGAPNGRAIRRWVGQEGKLPPGKKVGNEIVWLKSEVLAWLSVQRQVEQQKIDLVAVSLNKPTDLVMAEKRQLHIPQVKRRRPGRPSKMEVLARGEA